MKIFGFSRRRIVLCFVIFVVIATGCLYQNSPQNYTTNKDPLVQDRIENRDVPETHPSASLQNTESVEYWIVAFVNYERQEEGLEPLIWSPRLSQMADFRSYDMYNRSYLSHNEPDGGTYSGLLPKYGYKKDLQSAENLALLGYKHKTISPINKNTVKYSTPRELAKGFVRSWMHSGSHRWAMMHADYSIIGIGVYGKPEKGVIATQLFVDRERFDRAVDANTTEEFRVPIAEEDPLEDESGLENYPSHLGSNDDDDR